MQPNVSISAWFERLVDTLFWDVAARLLFTAAYGSLLYAALVRAASVWLHRDVDAWFFLEMSARVLGIANLSIPILIAIVRPRPIARLHGLMPHIVTYGGTF